MTENRKATNLMLDIFAYFEFLEFSGSYYSRAALQAAERLLTKHDSLISS